MDPIIVSLLMILNSFFFLPSPFVCLRLRAAHIFEKKFLFYQEIPTSILVLKKGNRQKIWKKCAYYNDPAIMAY